MAFGGEAAMNLLQCCGFELTVNDDGDAILKFVDAYEYKWLDGAVGMKVVGKKKKNGGLI